jgi:hypothetical protein
MDEEKKGKGIREGREKGLDRKKEIRTNSLKKWSSMQSSP